MINAVQLLYNDASLEAEVEFLIKRLEILQTDPPGLDRSYNIDRYLSSFCKVSHNIMGNQGSYFVLILSLKESGSY